MAADSKINDGEVLLHIKAREIHYGPFKGRLSDMLLSPTQFLSEHHGGYKFSSYLLFFLSQCGKISEDLNHRIRLREAITASGAPSNKWHSIQLDVLTRQRQLHISYCRETVSLLLQLWKLTEPVALEKAEAFKLEYDIDQ